MLRIVKRFPVTLQIDGVAIRASIKRLTLDEMADFGRSFARLAGRDRPGPPVDDPDEEERREAASRAWLVQVLTDYLALEPGQVFDEAADAYVTTGAEFLRAFGHRFDVLLEAVSKIQLENSLSADQKNVLRSQPGFAGTSPTPSGGQNPSGDAPGGTAGAASTPASTPAAGASSPAPPATSSPVALESPSSAAPSGPSI